MIVTISSERLGSLEIGDAAVLESWVPLVMDQVGLLNY
jgi:hypothetical protein